MTISIRQIWTIVALVCVANASSLAAAANHSSTSDVVDTAVAAKQFTTLVAAVQAADLVDVLKGKGPFTVFAPTDKAFEQIPKEQLAALLNDKEALQNVLTYHVVPGNVTAADVVKLQSAKTVQGEPVKIAVYQGKVKIDDANVVKTDIACSNGVIHVIDAVLMPPAK